MATSYQSEITLFLNELKQENPHLEAEQIAGRARLWDTRLDPQQLEDFRAARVPQKPYVYQTE